MVHADTVDRVLSAGSGHSLVSGVLSLEGEEARDLMPDDEEEGEERLRSRPEGVLAVHIKRVKFRNRHFTTYFDSGSSIGVYLHLRVLGAARATAVYKNVQFPSTIVLDDIKHFRVRPNPKHYDEENQIRLELIGFDRPDVHQIIAWRYVHLYDILKGMYVADTYKMVGQDNKTVAEVEIEYSFAYGNMGYGASNQLGNNKVRPLDLIRHSMFARPAPPSGRQIDEQTDVMNCIPVGAPSFIHFPHRSKLSNKHEYAPISTDSRVSIEPMMVSARIRHRMAERQEEMDGLRSRKQRVKYIRGIVNPPELHHATDSDEFVVPNTLRLKEYDGSKLNDFNTVSRPVTAASNYDDGLPADLEDLDAVLEQAPGLQMMRRGRSRPIGMPSYSDTSVGSGSSESGGAEGGRAGLGGIGGWLCDWLAGLFHQRRATVTPGSPTESEMSYEMKAVQSVYSARLNVLVQDRVDPRVEELPPEEDPSLDLVRRRMSEANAQLLTDHVVEYHGGRGFGTTDEEEEETLRRRTPVPNIV